MPKTICKHPKKVTEIEKIQFFQFFTVRGKKIELEPITMTGSRQHGFFSSLGIFWHNL